jgi:hypothetical protein
MVNRPTGGGAGVDLRGPPNKSTHTSPVTWSPNINIIATMSSDPNGAEAGAAFLEKNKSAEGVVTLQSGLQW